MLVKVTAKRQVTFPARVLDALGVKPGDRLELQEGVNTDKSVHRHFIQDYQLYTTSLVVVDVVNGRQARWKSLPKIWELLRDETAFRRYVQGEARDYLEKRS